MENDKYLELGREFYNWYSSGKLNLSFKAGNGKLDAEIQRVTELIAYVIEKHKLKG